MGTQDCHDTVHRASITHIFTKVHSLMLKLYGFEELYRIHIYNVYFITHGHGYKCLERLHTLLTKS